MTALREAGTQTDERGAGSFALTPGRLHLLRHAGVLAFTGIMLRAATSLILLAFSVMYPHDQYAALLPWVACQQLIVMLAPFGALEGLGRLMKHEQRDRAAALLGFLPRFIAMNLWFAAPLSLAMTWIATRTSLAALPAYDLILVLGAGVSVALMVTKHQGMALSGRTGDLAVDRTIRPAVQLFVSLSLAACHFSAAVALFTGQIVSASVVLLRRKREVPATAASRSAWDLYWELARMGWVFGLWSICGWFSGYGATLVLSRFAGARAITNYGQAVAVISLLGYAMGSASTALQAHLLKNGESWTEKIRSKVSMVYDASLLPAAAFAALALVGRVESWPIMRRAGMSWDRPIWFYFFVMYAADTFYQRTIIPFWYEPESVLPWGAVAVSEAVAFGAFYGALVPLGVGPLFANAAMVVTRLVALFWLLPPNDRRARVSKASSLAVATLVSLVVWACLRLT